MSQSSPLRIAVLGPGKIGSTFAFQLARSGGHDVTVIARPGSVRLGQLERDNAIIDTKAIGQASGSAANSTSRRRTTW